MRIARCVVVGLGVLSACANNVPQDRSTGPDGKIGGAKDVVLENGGASVRDIVTYPGGDRVDWKKLVLPAAQKGKLSIDLSWRTPRPGLKLAIDVFDENKRPVPQQSSTSRRDPRNRRSLAIPAAAGTYFVRVYAPRRGDAGAYQLKADFRPDAAPETEKPVELPPPPRLPEIPPPAPTTCTTHDPANPICETVCAPGAPASWKPCKAPEPPPPPPPPPAKAPDPVAARVLTNRVDSDGSLVVTISAGSEMGISRAWKGTLLRGDTQTSLPNGRLTIVRVDKRKTIAKVSVTPDILGANLNVLFTP